MKSSDMIKTMESAAVYAVAIEAARHSGRANGGPVEMREHVWWALMMHARSYGEPCQSAADHAKQRHEAAKRERSEIAARRIRLQG